MKCPACFTPLYYKGGENKEDFGCHNIKCKSRDIYYYTNVKVRPNWYFLAGYNLPFEYIDTHWRRPDYTYHLYSIVGPVGNKTQLQGLRLVDRCGIPSWNKDLQDYSVPTYKECKQEILHEIDYYALPANSDFTEQFNALKHRMINEWFDKYDPYKSRTKSAYNPFYDWRNTYYTHSNFDPFDYPFNCYYNMNWRVENMALARCGRKVDLVI